MDFVGDGDSEPGDDDDDEDEDEDDDEDEEDEDEGSVRRARIIPWGSWDTVLSRLAHQAHNVEGKLTLQLNIRRADPRPFNLDHLLPNFLGHGGSVDINCT